MNLRERRKGRVDTGRFGEGKGRGQVMESYFNFKTEENMRPY